MSEKPKKQNYKQLNQQQRDSLYKKRALGHSVSVIAAELGVHKSTLYRELKRNVNPKFNEYHPDAAQQLSRTRRRSRGSKIGSSKHLQQLIQESIVMSVSPEALAGRLKQEQYKYNISHESIYKWIYGEGRYLKLYESLTRKKRQRGFRSRRKKGQSKIPNRVSIHERPLLPAGEIGNWEVDTIHLSEGSESILTLYDKATKVTIGAKMTTRTTEETMDNLKEILSRLPEQLRKSMTFDNGSEFTAHECLKDFGVKNYFCDPYASWQKGGVENANGIIRRYIPKGSKGSDYSAEEVQAVIHRINMTPRKSINFRTPYEMLLQKLTGEDRIFPLFNL